MKENVKCNNCDNDTFKTELLYGYGVFVRLICTRCGFMMPEYGGG